MTAEGVFVTNKRGSRERGVVWQNVASALFAESLTVNARSSRASANLTVLVSSKV